MTNFAVDILQARDNSFNIGVQLANFFKNNPSILKTFEVITKPEIDIPNMKSIYTTFAPQLLEELEGMAQGLNLSFPKVASLFSGYDVPKTEAMGCSAIITKDYYVRNYDFTPDLYDGIFSLVQPEGTFASAGYNLQGMGRHDGVNQKGLVIGLHFVSNNDYTVGISPWISIRMVLDSCSTTEEAIEMLKEIPHSACYNFSIGDKNGSLAVVEASPLNVNIRREESLMSCENHFRTIEMKNQNRVSIDGSMKREQYLKGFKEKAITHEEMFEQFKETTSPLFFSDYDNLFGTLHTFSYSYANARILTTIAQSSEVLDIDLNEWVNGKNIDQHFLKGIIKV